MDKTSIFISYSHKDKHVKDRFLSHLRVFIDLGKITLISDDQISVGNDSEKRVLDELNKSNIIVLLISADYLNSDFILNVEVPSILKRKESEGLIIIPVIIRPCSWQSVDWLRRMNVFPRSGHPLLDGPEIEIDKNFTDLAALIADMVDVVTEKEIRKSIKAPPSKKKTEEEKRIEVFISHDHEDGDFAELLKLKIEEIGFSAWIDIERLSIGEDWRSEIDEAIKSSIALIAIMTPEARKSEYVTYEWAFALGVGKKVIPIMLKQTQLHPRLEALQYLDFTNRAARPWSQLSEIIKESKAKIVEE